ncbi:Hypothetical_protein [Hexamita inflata]|uniref:Hypothetical_protein n=1 Tax=Hexamita inflata TaxID=28002 RepID=A0AA86REH8_9EUKA|nr:Hypothetical protein HINF_LOCUS60266 [Hexamita inflata]
MPYIININTVSDLDIVWADTNDTEQLDVKQLEEQYEIITICGVNNNEFIDYQILNRTQCLEICQCTLDLSQIKGHINYIGLKNCTGINSFSECCINTVYFQDVNLQVSQLKQLKLNQLSIKLTGEQSLDFYNCYQLNCSLSHLILTKVKSIDLRIMKGNWNTVVFDDCTFCGTVENSQFQVNSVELSITEKDYQNNLISLQNLKCEYFSLQQIEQDTPQDFDFLYMSNENNQKTDITANFLNSTINLSKMASNWHNISLRNCKLLGDPNTYLNTFAGTSFYLLFDELCSDVDLNPFVGIQTKLIFEFRSIQVDYKMVQKCKPEFLTIQNTKIDLDKLCGTWDTIILENCVLNQVEYSSRKIIANDIKLIDIPDLDSDLLRYFVPQRLKINGTKQILQFPDVKELTILRSYICVTKPNYTVEHLTLSSVVFVKFSVLQLCALESLSINLSSAEPQFQIKEKQIKFLKCKQNFKSLAMQLHQQIDSEQNRIQHKNNQINRLNSLFDQIQTRLAAIRPNEE